MSKYIQDETSDLNFSVLRAGEKFFYVLNPKAVFIKTSDNREFCIESVDSGIDPGTFGTSSETAVVRRVDAAPKQTIFRFDELQDGERFTLHGSEDVYLKTSTGQAVIIESQLTTIGSVAALEKSRCVYRLAVVVEPKYKRV